MFGYAVIFICALFGLVLGIRDGDWLWVLVSISIIAPVVWGVMDAIRKKTKP